MPVLSPSLTRIQSPSITCFRLLGVGAESVYSGLSDLPFCEHFSILASMPLHSVNVDATYQVVDGLEQQMYVKNLQTPLGMGAHAVRAYASRWRPVVAASPCICPLDFLSSTP